MLYFRRTAISGLSIAAAALFVVSLSSPAFAESDATATPSPDVAENCFALDAEVVCDADVDALAAAVEDQFGIVATATDDELSFNVVDESTGELEAVSSGTAAREGAVVQAVYLRATFYEHADFGGGTFSQTASEACGSNTWQGVSDLGPYGWNDRISSWKVQSTCQVRLFEHENYGGGARPYSGQTSWVGAAYNDWASSLRTRY